MPSAGEVGSGRVSRWLGDLAGGRCQRTAGLPCGRSADFPAGGHVISLSADN